MVYTISDPPADKMQKTILLVDDDQETLKAYEEILIDLDYHVVARPDGDSALALLSEDPVVDLVITDYRMPGKNGLEFITLLRRLKPSVPVIMLTAYGNIETYLHSFSLGVFEYVSKPIRKVELERIIRKALHDDGPDGALTVPD